MKDKLIAVFFVIVIYIMMILSAFFEDRDISKTDRRKLVTKEDLKKDFNGEFDNYLSDQLPFREYFLNFNEIFNRYLLGNKEHNDVYIKDGFIIEKLYPLNEESVNHFIENINLIKSEYLSSNNCYFSIIPDKSFFLNDSKYLKIDYNHLFSKLELGINMSYIDIKDLFSLDDYYKTDIHLKQESYFKIMDVFSKNFDFTLKDWTYSKYIYSDFKGSSYYKVPFKKSEDLIYYSNDIIDKTVVEHLEFKNQKVYQLDKLDSSDAYNVFLSGPSSLIKITNNESDNNKELIIFRDSFSSSLAPLLIPYYKNIYLIDLRYISMKYVNKYIDMKNKDVLFLYSVPIINNSFILKF